MVSKSILYTFYFLKVDEWLKGQEKATSQEVIKVMRLGGSLNDEIMKFNDYFEVAKGQKVLLFLSRFEDGVGNPFDSYFVTNHNQGIYLEGEDSIFYSGS